LSTLDQAIRELNALQAESNVTESLAKEIRGEIADTFGMKGGVYRRKQELQNALDAYKKGRAIENIDKQSTYNLSNVITLSITFEGRSPTESDLREDIQHAIKHLETETQGPRKDEWWAWSDLGQFYLLSNNVAKARESYIQGLKLTGATRDEIDRHVEVLKELAKKTAEKTPEIAENIRAVINELTIRA
jgi:tetratricopeptide (TPR) repeat protein